jgi:hypothetical protein
MQNPLSIDCEACGSDPMEGIDADVFERISGSEVPQEVRHAPHAPGCEDEDARFEAATKDFTLQLLSKAIGTAMYLSEAASGDRSMLADKQELRLAIMTRKGWTWRSQ